MKNSMKNLCIFIPAWNVRNDVVDVLERIPEPLGRGCAEVFVLDNGSRDGTVEAVRDRLARGFRFPVNVYRNATNLGYGGSQKVAYAHAISQGYDAIAMLHGDGQYPPRHLPGLFDALRPGVGMAYGSRMLSDVRHDETPWRRRAGVRVLSALQNAASGMRLAEWYSGFRAFRCSALASVPFQACSNDYYFDVQILLLLNMAGHAIAEIPVAKRYEGNHSPVNIYQFGRQVLARMLHYPLVRAGVAPGRLYRKHYWKELKNSPVPAPIPADDRRARAAA